jgi:hypothetical protein
MSLARRPPGFHRLDSLGQFGALDVGDPDIPLAGLPDGHLRALLGMTIAAIRTNPRLEPA